MSGVRVPPPLFRYWEHGARSTGSEYTQSWLLVARSLLLAPLLPALMTDQWYFEIGDGKSYGPYSMEKLQKWAATGDLMPTHRVRNADSAEWIIAAYVPGLEQTLAATVKAAPAADPNAKAARDKSFTGLVRGFGRKKKRVAPGKVPKDGERRTDRAHRRSLRNRPTSSRCAMRFWRPPSRGRLGHPHRSGREHCPGPAARRRRTRTAAKAAEVDSRRADRPFQSALADGHRGTADGPGRPVRTVLGTARAQDSFSHGHAADHARRANHAAAAGHGDGAAHAQQARHVGIGDENFCRVHRRRSRA